MTQMVKNLPAMQETLFDPRVGKIPWRRAWQLTPVFMPGKSHGQRSLASYGPWGCVELDTKQHTHMMHRNHIEIICIHIDILSLSQLPQLRYSESATYEPLLLTHTHTHTPFSELKGKNPCIQI